jgi:hypothetical protein
VSPSLIYIYINLCFLFIDGTLSVGVLYRMRELPLRGESSRIRSNGQRGHAS